eukprot:TRINITY_DN4079_c0_g2_i1.p1 TRINITY_DN4079_c0_g2~~TRINITY_DN4079_c0_g2_i1.p1  ORF type:complete len:345 (-),score=32.63 TRINITY_DN4079_c0_g2_i1:473-1507(-)
MPSARALTKPAIDRETPTFTPGASQKCNCKRSKCLMLYCECFSANVLCDARCKCLGCENSAEHSEERQRAIKRKLYRSKRAFDPKFAPASATPGQSEFLHVRGCHCKRSNCQKQYCECFQAGVACGKACKCLDCANDGNLPHLRNFGVGDWVMPSTREATRSVIGVEAVAMVLPAADFGDSKPRDRAAAGQKRKRGHNGLAPANEAVKQAPDRKFFHETPPSWDHFRHLAATATASWVKREGGHSGQGHVSVPGGLKRATPDTATPRRTAFGVGATQNQVSAKSSLRLRRTVSPRSAQVPTLIGRNAIFYEYRPVATLAPGIHGLSDPRGFARASPHYPAAGPG